MFGMFIHSNLDVKLGKWKYLFNSPELHLWHHANYKEVFHANFSTKFATWDYLFKTVYDPKHKPGNAPKIGVYTMIFLKIISCNMLFQLKDLRKKTLEISFVSKVLFPQNQSVELVFTENKKDNSELDVTSYLSATS
jgi:sterol desaturase/sphingolipid hydroxylase (fatty acid hydroxylase superfamily)